MKLQKTLDNRNEYDIMYTATQYKVKQMRSDEYIMRMDSAYADRNSGICFVRYMKRLFKFDHYVLGFVCLLIVCILPAISPVVYFINNNNGIMPYLLIFVAIAGILYEYPPDKDAENILKIEQFAVYVSSFLFLSADLVVFIIRADAKAYTYNRLDYILMGYVIVPTIVTIIEFIRSAKEYFKTEPNNTTPKTNIIAVGNAANV